MLVDWALAARIQTCDPAQTPTRTERRSQRVPSQVTDSSTQVQQLWHERALDIPRVAADVRRSFTVSEQSATGAQARWSRIALVLSKAAPEVRKPRVRRYDAGVANDTE